MDVLRFGRALRAIRLRLGLSQRVAGARAGISASQVSRIEHGRVGRIPFATLHRYGLAVGGDVELNLRWRGEAIDRLVDEEHAALVTGGVGLLRSLGWEMAVEVSFAIGGERGSIDVLAWHPNQLIVAVGEMKSRIGDSQATLHVLDRKARLAPLIARDRGWPCHGVARLLFLPEGRTPRRDVARLGPTFQVAFPLRGRAVLAWLRRPTKPPISGLLFLPTPTRRRPSRLRSR